MATPQSISPLYSPQTIDRLARRIDAQNVKFLVAAKVRMDRRAETVKNKKAVER